MNVINEYKKGKGVLDYLTIGLLTDGDHHKQWCLNEALKLLLGEENYEKYRRELADEDYEFEEGIAP